MAEITLGPVVDQDDFVDPVEYVEEPATELATFAVHHGVLKLLCACLEPIRTEDVARGYHHCGRSIKVILQH